MFKNILHIKIKGFKRISKFNLKFDVLNSLDFNWRVWFFWKIIYAYILKIINILH